MGRLRVPTTDDWWLIYGEPSASPEDDTAFLVRGITQVALSELIRKATKSQFQKNPAGQWVPVDVFDVGKLIAGLKPYVAGWRNLPDVEGHPLEFSPEMLDRVLNLPGVVNTLIHSINRLGEARTEIEGAQVKN